MLKPAGATQLNQSERSLGMTGINLASVFGISWWECSGHQQKQIRAAAWVQRGFGMHASFGGGQTTRMLMQASIWSAVAPK